jgi:lipid A 3-O-deacylase
MKRLFVLLLLCAPALAQDPAPIAKGDWNLAVFVTGGHSANGDDRDGGIITSRLHLGKILTADHGPGFLRGKFEMGAEVVPVNVFWQGDDPNYGFGVTPLLFKWNFTSSRKVVPYIEVAGGMLWSVDGVPPGSANFNFTPQASFGLQFLRSDRKAVSIAVEYMHISNGGRVAPNPGINTIQARVAFHWFK